MTIDRGPATAERHVREARRLLRWLFVVMPHGVPVEDPPHADPEYDRRLLREERVTEVRDGD